PSTSPDRCEATFRLARSEPVGRIELIADAEQLPALEGEGDVPLLPDPVVEVLQIKIVPACCDREQVEELQLPGLIAQTLTRVAGEEDRLLPGCLLIHRNESAKPFGRFLQGEFTEREGDVELGPQGPQPHGVGNELGASRTVVEQAGNEHEFLVVEGDTLLWHRV